MEHVKVDEDDYDYCVRWKGWGPKWDTWHSQEDLMGCQQLIKDYWRRLSEGHIAVCLQPQEAMMVQSENYDMNLAMFMGQMGATVNPTIYKSTIMHQDQVLKYPDPKRTPGDGPHRGKHGSG